MRQSPPLTPAPARLFGPAPVLLVSIFGGPLHPTTGITPEARLKTEKSQPEEPQVLTRTMLPPQDVVSPLHFLLDIPSTAWYCPKCITRFISANEIAQHAAQVNAYRHTCMHVPSWMHFALYLLSSQETFCCRHNHHGSAEVGQNQVAMHPSRIHWAYHQTPGALGQLGYLQARPLKIGPSPAPWAGQG